jgi:hypothetical protein
MKLHYFRKMVRKYAAKGLKQLWRNHTFVSWDLSERPLFLERECSCSPGMDELVTKYE